MDKGPQTLTEMLIKRLRSGHCLRTIDIQGTETENTYSDIFQESLKKLVLLQAHGVQSGNELVIQVSEPLEFIKVFWACLLGGIIAVPLTIANNRQGVRKLFNVLNRLRAPYLYSNAKEWDTIYKNAVEVSLENNFIKLKDNTIITNETHSAEFTIQPEILKSKPDDLAFIQFSSGSTGTPKGVMLSHRNVMTNLETIIDAYQLDQEKNTFLSWMPLTHDMGMVGFHLTPLSLDIDQTIMATSRFVHDPGLWLKKLSQYKISVTSSPNFGYEHLLKRGNIDKLVNIDLSNLSLIVNGAEPISPYLCNEFSQRLSKFGLAPNTIVPSYGMAEAGVFVTCPERGRAIGVVEVNRRQLGLGDKVIKPESPSDAISLVELGVPGLHIEMRIVNEQGLKVEDSVIGNIEIKGENITSGYYCDEESTKNAFTSDGWLKTGDHGFINNGQLVFAGRAKDMICSNGQNLYAQDVEQAIAEQLNFDIRKIAVCGAPGEINAKEELIAFIVKPGSPQDIASLQLTLQSKLNSIFGYQLHRLIPVKSIPMTTSGKKQRQSLQEAYIKNEYAEILKNIEQYIPSQSKTENKDIEWKNPIEQKIAEICQQELPDVVIGRTDDLFQLGLNSLGATRVLVNLQETFNVALPPDMLLVCMNIATLSQRIETFKESELYKGLSVDVDLNKIGSFLKNKYNIDLKLVRYLSESESCINLYCKNEEKIRILDILRTEIEPPVYPDFFTPLSEQPDSIDGIVSIKKDELIKKFNLLPFNESSTQHFIDSLEFSFKRIESEFEKEICETEFAVGPHQRRHLRRKLVQPHVYDIVVHASSLYQLTENLRDFIKMQDLLRSSIHDSINGYYFKIRRFNKDISIPTIDISSYQQEAQNEMCNRVFAWFDAQFISQSYIGCSLFNIIVIKLSETRYSIRFLISHLISDHEAGRILKTFIEQKLHTGNAPERPLSYKQFVETIAEPSGSAGERFCNTGLYKNVEKSMVALLDQKKISTHNIHPTEPVSIIFRYEFLNSALLYAHQRPMNYAFFVYLTIVSKLYPAAQIPIKVALNRRVFGLLNFNNTIGEFHDNIIMAIDSKEISLEYCNAAMNEVLKFMDTEGYYLSAMKDDKKLQMVAGSTPFSFNHLGNFNHDEDTIFINRIKSFPLTFFPSISFSIENKWIRLILNNGLNAGQINQIQNVMNSLNLDFSITLLSNSNKSEEVEIHKTVEDNKIQFAH